PIAMRAIMSLPPIHVSMRAPSYDKRRLLRWPMTAAACGLVLALTHATAEDNRALLAERVTALTRESHWTLEDRVPVSFRTFHPQGMVRIGETFFVSSVEVLVPPKRLPAAAAGATGYDRDTGEGVGHLFKIDRSGR